LGFFLLELQRRKVRVISIKNYGIFGKNMLIVSNNLELGTKKHQKQRGKMEMKL
jgi:hypothetical protein